MKKLSLVTLFALITIGFSSCSAEDDLMIQDTNSEDLLKSFALNKSADGKYSLDYQVGDGAAADQEKDYKTNTNNIYLYSSNVQSKSSFNDDLFIENGQLKVNFRNTINDKVYTITVEDDDIQTSKNSEENNYLDSYGISGNGDGSYDLDFRVKDGVAVEFLYNGDLGIYEVHLSEDSSASGSDFSQTYTKQEGVTLKIDFVNHGEGRSNTTRKPRGSVDD